MNFICINSNFIENSSEEGGVLYAMDGFNEPLIFEKCVFLNNSANSYLFLAYNTKIILNATLLQENINNFFLLIFTNLTFINSSVDFHFCYSHESGCFIKAIEKSWIFINNSSLISIESRFINNFMDIENSFINIDDSFFSNIHVGGSCILSLNSQIISYKSFFLDYDINCIYVDTGNLTIFETFFDNHAFNSKEITKTSEGTVICKNCISILISNSSFVNNTNAYNGGAIFITSLLENYQDYLILNCNFLQNKVKKSGGAIYIYGSRVLIFNNSFIKNEAKYGASIYFDSNQNISLNIENNRFSQNKAVYEGGAIKWSTFMPKVSSTNKFTDNLALYGENIASFPIQMNVYIVFGEDKMNLSEFLSNENWNMPLIQNIASGQELQFNISVEVVDHYNQIVKTVDYSK